MAIHTLNDGADIRAPKPWDERTGYWDDVSNSWKPYPSVQDALDFLVYRYEGQTVTVTVDDILSEYWFSGGVLDEHFVPKTPPPVEPTFIHLDPGEGFTYTVNITPEMREMYGPDPTVQVATRLSDDAPGEWTDQMNNVYRVRGSEFELLSITFSIDNLETLIVIK